jgi:hypothetical protein
MTDEQKTEVMASIIENMLTKLDEMDCDKAWRNSACEEFIEQLVQIIPFQAIVVARGIVASWGEEPVA